MKFTFPPESTPLPGFTLKRAIHRGGFGEVYYALTDAGKEVALKLLHAHTEVELRGSTQCLNLNHPNLITIFDIKTDPDGDHWIVMEYAGGKRLADVIADRGRLPVEEIERWLDGLTAGLSFLHERGIVHRDLKPANVYSDNGIVKLGDVGLSKLISESGRSAQTQSVGTVYYMAPEVARGRYGREVDIYALGVMLYEMLTGTLPFDGESTGEILMKHLTARPNLEKLPPALRPVLARALEKDPAKRTASVTRLRDEFKAAVRGRAVAPRAVPVQYEDEAEPIFDEPWHTFQTNAGPAAGSRGAAPARPVHPARRAGQALGRPNYSKAALLVVLLFLAMGFGGGGRAVRVLWELAIFGAIGYGVFAVARTLFGLGRQIPQPTPVPPARPTAVAARTLPRTRRRTISFGQRIKELSGSMTITALAMAGITGLLVPTGFLNDAPSAVFFAVSSTIAAWGLLATSKLSEDRDPDGGTQRVLQGATGAVVGVLVCGLANFLMIDLAPHSSLVGGNMHGVITHVGDLRLAGGNGAPTGLAFIAFFAGLFFFRRWWLLADAWRSQRLRISSVLLTGLLGYALTTLGYFPHGLGLMWAVALGSTVQLAAAWTPLSHRQSEPRV